MSILTQRIRDPIHGLIVFDQKDDPTDMLAWRLIETPEFQRLRRVKQLGVTELVFPGATHSRFAHSIGVYHNARKLMRIIKKNMGSDYDKDRARVALLAALLHDIGHGPFSHAFEGARKEISKIRGTGPIRKHEAFSSILILAGDSQIKKVLDTVDHTLASDISNLLKADDPSDFYHAVVSSSFDADRLDYLMRDRYMTGTHAGTIDEDWLLNNLTTQEIHEYQEGCDDPIIIPTFVFRPKARQAAEDFLLARFRLHTQVYFHKTTRGFEKLFTGLCLHVAADTTDKKKLGLPDSHPLLEFLALDGEKIETFRRLDDTIAWSAIEQLQHCSDSHAAMLANRLWNRGKMKHLDVSLRFENDPESMSRAISDMDQTFAGKIGVTIFKDIIDFNIYSEANGETAKAHKIVRVLDGGGHQADIVRFSDTIISDKLMNGVGYVRYYFLETDDWEEAEKVTRGR